MWSDDRRYHERRLREAQYELGALLERFVYLGRELADDDYDGTEDARARLAEARAALQTAAGSVEQALHDLPEGKQRAPLPSL